MSELRPDGQAARYLAIFLWGSVASILLTNVAGFLVPLFTAMSSPANTDAYMETVTGMLAWVQLVPAVVGVVILVGAWRFAEEVLAAPVRWLQVAAAAWFVSLWAYLVLKLVGNEWAPWTGTIRNVLEELLVAAVLLAAGQGLASLERRGVGLARGTAIFVIVALVVGMVLSRLRATAPAAVDPTTAFAIGLAWMASGLLAKLVPWAALFILIRRFRVA